MPVGHLRLRQQPLLQARRSRPIEASFPFLPAKRGCRSLYATPFLSADQILGMMLVYLCDRFRGHKGQLHIASLSLIIKKEGTKGHGPHHRALYLCLWATLVTGFLTVAGVRTSYNHLPHRLCPGLPTLRAPLSSVTPVAGIQCDT
jgi:hypothetical protein